MLERVRRLLPLVATVVFADTMLFSALIPLLPSLAHEHGLSKLTAGLVLGAYGAGAVVSGIPSGLVVARVGARRAVTAGLVLLAVASVWFAFADAPVMLGAARFAQGFASALTWTAALAWVAAVTPTERRGQALGTVVGAAVAGFVIGPVIGAGADVFSIEIAFTAVAVFSAALAVLTVTMPEAPREHWSPGALRLVLADQRFLAGLWLTFLSAGFFGALDLLAPLTLDAAGWSVVAIGVVFLVAGSGEAALNPFVGRLSDRRGRLYPVRIALACSVLVTVGMAFAVEPFVVAVLVMAASVAFGGLYTPVMALASERAERVGLPQGLGVGVLNSSWAAGMLTGPAFGGWFAQEFGDAALYLFVAAVCGLTLAAVTRPRRLAPA